VRRLQRSQLLPSAAPSSNQKQDSGSIGRRYRPIPKCGLDTSPKKWCVPYPTCLRNRGIANTIVQLQSRAALERILGKACEAGTPGVLSQKFAGIQLLSS
jgi:hypothetical protein